MSPQNKGRRRAVKASGQAAIVQKPPASDVVFGVDKRGRACLWNQGAVELFGHAASAVIGQACSTVCRTRACAAQCIAATQLEQYARGRPLHEVVRVELCGPTVGTIAVEVVATPVVLGGAVPEAAMLYAVRLVSKPSAETPFTALRELRTVNVGGYGATEMPM
ncbi:MAG: PAS domain-containing protein [Dehalococcoidia bacterium]|nr:PAS domain-containing protein [Dehalococcoidia bacterium]